MAHTWTPDEAPDQTGRTAVITGANAGIGLQIARALARRGGTVILACRDRGRGERAASLIRTESPGADIQVVALDLASLASVRNAATEIVRTSPRLDLLINNAGVMQVPYQRTEDGLELTLATNHLGHFALTGLLIDRLLAAPGSRVVNVSSLAHRHATVRFDDLNGERDYDPADAYGQSKLANLLFTYELQDRLDASGSATVAIAAHPGIVETDLWRTSSRLERVAISRRLRPLNFWLSQDAAHGALPILRAALDPTARGGEYYGPGGPGQFAGRPERVEPSAASRDPDARRRLWDASEELTGISWLTPSGDDRSAKTRSISPR
jgi:NAD(P)-dependent dehydrogenase (short-subunit alcohol dehydrogenase family)